MFKYLKGILPAFFLFQSFTLIAQEDRYSNEVEKKIASTEKSLSGWVNLTDGDWNLQQRMKYHKIHGVSIAVIKDYKLEWARGLWLCRYVR